MNSCQSRLCLAIAGALFPASVLAQAGPQDSPSRAGGGAGVAQAAGSAQAVDESAGVAELDKIVVTGSRIKRSEVEGPAPVTVLDRDEIRRRGFTTAYEALYTLSQATGSGLQTQFNPNGATANATNVDLRGLGPGRTLILINGRRAADYPLPFNGISNIVNLSSIPAAAIDRIEVLASGASAIYGSDAVAGVINFVLRDSFDGIEATVRLGGTTEGGGASQRIDLVGGIERGALHGMYALEYFRRQPILALDRDHFDSTEDAPEGVPPRNDLVYGILRPLALAGLLPPPILADPGDVCGNFGRDVGRNSYLGLGFACTTRDLQAQRTIRHATRDKSGFLNLAYDFDGGLQLFGTAALWQSGSKFHTQAGTNALWQPPAGLVFDVGPGAGNDLGTGGEYITPIRFFQINEMPEPDQIYDEMAWDAVLGLRGNLADRFDWEVAFHHSDYAVDRDQRVLLAQSVNDFFLGPQLGVDPIFGLTAHSVRRDRLSRALTPQEYYSLSTLNHTEADSSSDQFTAQLTGDLFHLPAGAVGFAGVLEWGTQDYRIELDPRLNSGAFHGVFSEVPGGGERDRYAAGVEFAVPVTDALRLTLAGRYDKYDDITDVDDALTYNVGLEFRPVDRLLLRGSYATSFRAPDMHFVFAGASVLQSAPLDQLRCRRDQGVTDLADCTLPPSVVVTRRAGNAGLEEENGRSWTAGLVWNVTDALDLSLDYYDIRLEDIVNDVSFGFILETEADCVLGHTIEGTPVDPDSALCDFARQSVIRDETGALVEVNTGPINRAFQSVRGIDGTLNYLLDTERLGDFRFSLSWSHVLEQQRQEFAADPAESYRDDPDNLDLRSKLSGSVTWSKGAWTHTLFGYRRGSRPRYDGHGRTGSYTTWNYSFSYQATPDIRFSLIVDDLLNEDPRIDETFTQYPFFYNAQVNPVGREVFLEASYRF